MKYFKTITFTLLTLLSFTDLLKAQQPKTAVEMNDYLVNVIDSVYARGQQWGSKLNEANTTGDYKALAGLRHEMESYIDGRIKEYKASKDVAGSEEFRKTMIDFLYYEKKMISAFAEFEKLTSKSTKEEKDKMLQNLVDLSKDESAELNKVRAVQEEFAKKNGFTIQKTEE